MIKALALAAAIFMVSATQLSAGCGFLGLFGCGVRHHHHHGRPKVIVKHIYVVRHTYTAPAAELPPIAPVR